VIRPVVVLTWRRYAVGRTVIVGRVKAKVVPLLVECRV
jgi:hypothetical protein